MTSSANCQQILAAYGFTCPTEIIAGLKDSRLEMDSAKIDACLTAERNTASCDGSQPPECEDAIRGKVQGGGSCFDSQECVSGSFCSYAANACPGTCTLQKNLGDTVGPNDQCAKDLYTYGTKCAAKVAANGSCAPVAPETTQQECVTGYFCNSGNTCVQRLAANSPCSSDSQCSANLQCVGATGSQACKPAGSVTDACAFGGSTYPDCKQDLYCDVASFSNPTGTCKVLESANGPCLFDQACQPSLYCAGESLTTNPPTKGNCTARKANGAACLDGECATASYCTGSATVQGTCAARKADGASCAASEECGTNSTCNAGVCTNSGCVDPTP